MTIKQAGDYMRLSRKLWEQSNLPPKEMAQWKKLKAKSDTRNAAIEAMSAKGRIYQVRINRSITDFIDWDAPLRNQPPKARSFFQVPDTVSRPKDPEISLIVRKAQRQNDGYVSDLDLIIDNDRALYDMARSHARRNAPDAFAQFESGDLSPGGYVVREEKDYIRGSELRDITGGTAFRTLESKVGAEAAAEQAKAAGLAGVRYLDGGSRDDGDGTRNFVVFDENDVDIISIEAMTRARMERLRARGLGNPRRLLSGLMRRVRAMGLSRPSPISKVTVSRQLRR